jgi:signal peptidase II
MSGFGFPQRCGAVLVALVLILDQLSKWWLYDYLVVGGHRMVELLPFFNLVAVWNYGVSFGMFNNGSAAGAWVFIGLALIIIVVLALWMRRALRTVPAAALGLVIGGALGNVVDRIRFGAVFDFLDVHAMGWHWPAFNVADSAITVGVAVLLIDSLFQNPDKGKT